MLDARDPQRTIFRLEGAGGLLREKSGFTSLVGQMATVRSAAAIRHLP
jgi:hypothetical protein